VVSLGESGAAFPKGAIATGPRYGLHLSSSLPIKTLLQALSALRGKRSPRAVLLVADPPHPRRATYREHLHLGDQQQVLSIRRTFRKRHRAEPRPMLVGVVWKLDEDPATPAQPFAGAPWRTVRALFRQSRLGIFRHVVAHESLTRMESFRSNLLSQLTPASLRALAADLDYRAVHPSRGDFVFAHAEARIEERAMLRGPLFIDAGVTVGHDHVHVGPGWITPESPPVTLPDERDLPGNQEPDAAEALLAARHDGDAYFVAPRPQHRPVYEVAKRTFDIFFSLFALLITLPICVVAAIAIKLYDRGPILFEHKRESVHGKPFGCLKFRTMVRDAEAMKKKLREANQVDGPQFKIALDPRITPVGQFLRKTNIDELPQFINVLLGDMSVVGPRPSPFEENQLCPAWREARLSVKPGITGLWQVSRSRKRGTADFQEWIYYDTQYVDRRSFVLDMRIILLTIKELFGQGQ
jgi:lipopolysaccharide/colanic/teichoic acid biosynthesis glycosyltransferase